VSGTGSSLTLVLQDITLTGRNNNNVSLVRVESGGTLEMKAGALITGNTNTSASSSVYGGGVYVAGGTFTMSGGEISDNTASSASSGIPDGGGGGVSVTGGGTFTMSGG
jgi:hypothetical protein